MNVVFVGNVDAGKSTLCGEILLPSLDERTINLAREIAKNNKKDSFWKAYLLDTDDFEREKGITVNYTRIPTIYGYNILDCPGHADFVQNMIQGSSMANLAVLVVSCKNNEYERSLKGQTLEHALLIYTLNIKKVIVAINKMDEKTSSTSLEKEWNEERYQYIVENMSKLLKNIGFKVKKDVTFIPISAFIGIGIHNNNIITNESLNNLIKNEIKEIKEEIEEYVIVNAIEYTDSRKKIICNGPLKNDTKYYLNTINNCSELLIKDFIDNSFYNDNIEVYDVISPKNLLKNILLINCYITGSSILAKGFKANIHINGFLTTFEILDLYKDTKDIKKLSKIVFGKKEDKILIKIKIIDSIPIIKDRIIIREGNKTIAIGSIIVSKFQ